MASRYILSTRQHQGQHGTGTATTIGIATFLPHPSHHPHANYSTHSHPSSELQSHHTHAKAKWRARNATGATTGHVCVNKHEPALVVPLEAPGLHSVPREVRRASHLPGAPIGSKTHPQLHHGTRGRQHASYRAIRIPTANARAGSTPNNTVPLPTTILPVKNKLASPPLRLSTSKGLLLSRGC